MSSDEIPHLEDFFMKATGIVRRIDELGRVVIPKEIRRTLRIREGDPLELFTDRDELMLKKYSPIASVERFAEGTAKSLNEQSGCLAAICDGDTVLSAAGTGKKSLVGKTVSEKLAEVMDSRIRVHKGIICTMYKRRIC